MNDAGNGKKGEVTVMDSIEILGEDCKWVKWWFCQKQVRVWIGYCEAHEVMVLSDTLENLMSDMKRATHYFTSGAPITP